MFVGRGFPSRADEIREYRLFYLIKYYFNGFPTESEVSSMFQETQSRSKSLIRQILSRFHYDLKEDIDNTLKNTLSLAEYKDQDEEYHLTTNSDIIIEELNQIIKRDAPKCKVIKKISGTGRNYVIPPKSYDALISNLYPESSESTEE